jgi:hypothetical protein
MTMVSPGVDIGLFVVIIGSMVLYLLWLLFFLRQVRPALARILGRCLGMPIHEQGRGQWAVQGSNSAGGIASIADIAFLLTGVLGPLIIGSCIFFARFGP